MFNSRPVLRHVPIAPGQVCVVVDDFLREPHALRALAARERAQFATDPANSYPGVELGMPQAWAFALDEFFMQHIRRALGARRTISVSARLSMATLAPAQLSPLQRLCHRDAAVLPPDQGIAACVAYLFEDARMGGTSFYRPRGSLDETARLLRAASEHRVQPDAAYLTASNPWFEQVATIPAAFNRAIFYDGGVFHAARIEAPALLSDDPASGRLTLNGFFRHRRAAA